MVGYDSGLLACPTAQSGAVGIYRWAPVAGCGTERVQHDDSLAAIAGTAGRQLSPLVRVGLRRSAAVGGTAVIPVRDPALREMSACLAPA